jgi:hypothetical protein
VATTTTTMPSTAMSALSSGAVFAPTLMARIPNMTLSIASLIRMEVIERLLPARWHRSTVTVMRIIAIVNVAVKATAAMKPWSSSDE